MKKQHAFPSPIDLRYFLEVANLLNLSRAAESLGISQPSLTLAIRRLETSVGEDILMRHKRGVTLTRVGMQLLMHARSLLEQWESIRLEAVASIHEIQGSFTIGCHISLGLDTLPRFLADLMEKNPKLEIKLEHDLSRKITDHVINLTVDIGIVANPIRHPDLVIKHLYHDRVQLWTNGSKRKNTNPHSGEAVFICDPDLIQTKNILKKLKKENIAYSRIIYSNSLEVIAKLVKEGCGIGILPSNVATPYNLISINKKIFHQDEICLLYRGENRNIRAIQVITEAIKQAVT